LIRSLAPQRLPSPPTDRTNRYADDPLAIAFGKKLFFDPRFSGRLLDGDNDGGPATLGRKGETGRVACAGCHVPESGFLDSRTHGHAISLAAGWGRRHAPSLLDIGQAQRFMWDGRRDTLYSQVFEVIESPVEMNSSRLFVAQQLARLHRKDYEKLFGKLPAFDDPKQYPQLSAAETGCVPAGVAVRMVCDGKTRGMPGDHAEFDGLPDAKKDAVNRAVVNMGKAIASYERQLTCGPGRFDAWANGEASAMTSAEQRGLKIFIGKGKCVTCHSGPYLSDQEFHNVGLIPQTVAVVFRDTTEEDAYTGLKTALNDPLNSRSRFSDGNDGRLPHSPGDELKGAYKTPMLRCVGQRLTFMRTGQLGSLPAVVNFFDRGGSGINLVGKSELEPLGLTTEEKGDLVQFLKALDGPGPGKDLLAP